MVHTLINISFTYTVHFQIGGWNKPMASTFIDNRPPEAINLLNKIEHIPYVKLEETSILVTVRVNCSIHCKTFFFKGYIPVCYIDLE